VRDVLDQKLKLLHDASERISANLVEFELDADRRLLDATTLHGESAASWSAASAALTELWRRHALLEDLLRRADALPRARRTDELRSLLEAPSIELVSAEVPLMERSLLGGSESTERCTVDALLASMSSSFDEVKAVVKRIADDLQAAAALKRGFDARIMEAREALEQLRIAERAAHAAHEELVVKIAGPAAPLPADASGELEIELRRIVELGRAAAWAEARRALDAWSARAGALRDDVRRALEANRAPLAARNQLRSLLDAYQAKARRIGLLEDPRLEGIFAQAEQTLYTAPTDLAVAERLVSSYQQLLTASQPAPEAMR
jgi:hypothetical protein